MSEAALVNSSHNDLRVVSPKQTVGQQLRDIWRYRELLAGMVRKELKVRYKGSILGFLWSLLNPALYLVVYYVVFQIILGNGIPRFAVYLLSGLLVWNFFSTALSGACGAVVANASIVNKVAFPREVLALASVGASLIHLCLQSIVLLVALAFFQHAPSLQYMTLIPLALLAIMVLAGGLGILLSAVNVKLRDTQHLLELAILTWFWATPIVYPYMFVATKLAENDLPTWLYRLNPVTPIVMSFQRGIYNETSPLHTNESGAVVKMLPDDASVLWYAAQLGVVLVAGLGLFLIALKVFARLQSDFAEDL